MAQISWERITKEQSIDGVQLSHADHIGRRDGRIVSLLVRQLDGRWAPFIAAPWGWAEAGHRYDIRAAKSVAEDIHQATNEIGL